MVYALEDREIEVLGEEYFIADSADVIGSVVLHNNASIWFNTVIRADNDVISIVKTQISKMVRYCILIQVLN